MNLTDKQATIIKMYKFKFPPMIKYVLQVGTTDMYNFSYEN